MKMELLHPIGMHIPASSKHYDHQVRQGAPDAVLGLPCAQDSATSGGPAGIPHATVATATGVTGHWQLTSPSDWKQLQLGGTSSRRFHRPRGASIGSLSMADGASTSPDLQAIVHHKHKSMSGFPLPVIPRPGSPLLRSPLPGSPLAGRPPVKSPGSSPSGIHLPDRFLSISPRPLRQPFAHGLSDAKGASTTEDSVAALRAEERGTLVPQRCGHWQCAGASLSAAARVIRSPNRPSTVPLNRDSRLGVILSDDCGSARHVSPWGTSMVTAGVSRECHGVRVAAAGSSPSGTDAGWRTDALSSCAKSGGSRPGGSNHNPVALPMPPPPLADSHSGEGFLPDDARITGRVLRRSSDNGGELKGAPLWHLTAAVVTLPHDPETAGLHGPGTRRQHDVNLHPPCLHRRPRELTKSPSDCTTEHNGRSQLSPGVGHPSPCRPRGLAKCRSGSTEVECSDVLSTHMSRVVVKTAPSGRSVSHKPIVPASAPLAHITCTPAGILPSPRGGCVSAQLPPSPLTDLYVPHPDAARWPGGLRKSVSDKEAYASGAAAADGTPAEAGFTTSYAHETAMRQVPKCMSDKEGYTGGHMWSNSNSASPEKVL